MKGAKAAAAFHAGDALEGAEVIGGVVGPGAMADEIVADEHAEVALPAWVPN